MADAYATLASGGVRHRPTGIERVVFPDGKSENLASGEGKRVLTDGEAYEVTKILEMNVQSRHRHRRQLRLPRRRQDRHHRRGQGRLVRRATRPHLSAAVWVGYPDAGIAMPGAQGGTYAAPVWHAFMLPAHGDDCDDFPLPEQPAEFHPFFGKYSSTGKPVDATTTTTTTATTTTTDDSGGTGTDAASSTRRYYEAGAAEPARRPGAAGEQAAPARVRAPGRRGAGQ